MVVKVKMVKRANVVTKAHLAEKVIQDLPAQVAVKVNGGSMDVRAIKAVVGIKVKKDLLGLPDRQGGTGLEAILG